MIEGYGLNCHPFSLPFLSLVNQIEPYFGNIIDFALKTNGGNAFEFICFIGEGKIK